MFPLFGSGWMFVRRNLLQSAISRPVESTPTLFGSRMDEGLLMTRY